MSRCAPASRAAAHLRTCRRHSPPRDRASRWCRLNCAGRAWSRAGRSLARVMQQRGQRTVPARPVAVDLCRRDHLDRLRGREIERARGVIAVVVAEIRTDDDQGLGPAPQRPARVRPPAGLPRRRSAERRLARGNSTWMNGSSTSSACSLSNGGSSSGSPASASARRAPAAIDRDGAQAASPVRSPRHRHAWKCSRCGGRSRTTRVIWSPRCATL